MSWKLGSYVGNASTFSRGGGGGHAKYVIKDKRSITLIVRVFAWGGGHFE